MGHEKQPAESKEKNSGNEEICEELEASRANANVNDDKEIEEIEEVEEIQVRSDKTFHERMILIMEKFASYRLGQAVIERTDRMLKIIEDTAKWSLPPDQTDVKLERPLPWITFIALIILLRVIRFWCSVGSLIMRFQPVRPQQMVYFIQNRRRSLRVIRIQGLKTIRSREPQPSISCRPESVRNVDEGFLRKLRNLLSGAVCKPGHLHDVPSRNVFIPFSTGMDVAEIAPSNDSNDGSGKKSRKSKKEEDDEADLTIAEMLDKYANEDSDDSEYDPRDDEDDSGSTTTSCSSSAEETERENQQALPESINRNENSENKDNEIIENGDSKTAEDNESKPEADKHIEQVDFAKEKESHENGSSETVEQNNDSGESNVATAEVAPPSNASTPKTNPSHTHLTVPLLEEEKQKSTPGHETAASLKPPVVTSTTGSPQDFHSIFHPAPIVKGSTTEGFHFSSNLHSPENGKS